MGLISNFFGYRWSMYILYEGKIAYAMHENSVLRMLGYVMSYFANGNSPKYPWEIVLNFNRNNSTIRLLPSHFLADGDDISQKLLNEIFATDSGWQVKGAEPVFEEAATKKRLKITNTPTIRSSADIIKMMKMLKEPREITFFSLMDSIFEKN